MTYFKDSSDRWRESRWLLKAAIQVDHLTRDFLPSLHAVAITSPNTDVQL